MQPFGHNRHGPKIGEGSAPFLGGEAGSPSNTMWPGPSPTCIQNFILIHPTVWPQYTNVTDRRDRRDRTDRQENGPIAQGEPFYKRSPKNHMSKLRDIFCTCCLWPWLGPPLTTMQYILRTSGFVDDVIISHNCANTYT